DLELTHQPRDALLADPQPAGESQLGMQARRPVGFVGCPPRLPDQRLQPLVLEATAAGRTLLPGPVALPADVQHRAQPGDGGVRPALIDQPERHGSRPVSRAKYAAAFCRISFSSSNRRTSRFKRTISTCSWLVRPGRVPSSISAWRTHFRSVSAPIPNAWR